jgi:hypothetical protein
MRRLLGPKRTRPDIVELKLQQTIAGEADEPRNQTAHDGTRGTANRKER